MGSEWGVTDTDKPSETRNFNMQLDNGEQKPKPNRRTDGQRENRITPSNTVCGEAGEYN